MCIRDRPDTGGPELETRISSAATALNAMGLRCGYARLILMAGHGSTSANNPHAAGLDCGACGGQTGEVNARVLAHLLNDPAAVSYTHLDVYKRQVQGTVRARPQGRLARGLYPWLFAGLYLDELFTRLTFWLWPARPPATPGTLKKPAALANIHTTGDL